MILLVVAMDRLDDVLARAVEHLRPPPIETLPAWIERVIRLPEGPYDLCLCPLVEIDRTGIASAGWSVEGSRNGSRCRRLISGRCGGG